MELQRSSSSSSSKSKSKSKRPRRDSDEDSGDLIVDIEMSPSSSSKLRQPQAKLLASATPSSTNSSSSKKRRKRESASSDEERWLTAIESGKLEDVDDELKKIKPKDPSLMTARQRAMYDRSSDIGTPSQNLISLPTGYKEKVMTPEAIQKAQIKSQKRKQVADEKREKDKKKTLERLLKKQESKALKTAKLKNARASVPVILYRQNNERTIVSYPVSIDYPLKPATAVDFKPKLCSMNCGNLKKYSCSKTGAALCSIQCYKRNISSRIL